MDNSTSIWRSRAKVVAVLDIVLSSFYLLATIICIGLSVVGIDLMTNKRQFRHLGDDQDADVVLTGFVVITWITTGVLSLVTAVNMWAAIRLLNATELGRNTQESLALAKTWRIVCMIFLCFAVMCDVITASYYCMAVHGFVNSIFMYVVSQYIFELQRMIHPHAVTPLHKI